MIFAPFKSFSILSFIDCGFYLIPDNDYISLESISYLRPSNPQAGLPFKNKYGTLILLNNSYTSLLFYASITAYSTLSEFICSAIDFDSRSSFSFDKMYSIFLLSKRVILLSWMVFASFSFGESGLQIYGIISSNSPPSTNS